MIYLDLTKYNVQNEKPFSTSKLLGALQLQFRLMKDYWFNSKEIRTALYSIIQKEQPGIIHHNNEIFLNRNAIRAGIKAKAAQVVHERSLGNYGHNYVNLFADKLLMKKVAARIDISKAVADHFDHLHPATVSKKIVLHDVVDTKKFCAAAVDKNIKASLGIADDELVITSIGRIIKWKGQHILIEAINLLKEKLGNFKVLFVGPDDDGIGSAEYKKELQQLAVQYNLSDHIIFTGNRDDIPALINFSNVIVHSAIKPEPQGLVVIETLLCNKPLIASGSGGSGELVEKYGGIALQRTDAATLAEKLEEVLINKNIPVINHAKLKQDFDAEHQVSVLTQLYNKVLVQNAE